MFWSLSVSLSLCSSCPPWHWSELCPSRFVERLLSEVFAWQRRLPSWSGAVDRLAYSLHRPMAHSCLSRRRDLPARRHLVLSRRRATMFVRGKEASQGIVICWKFCHLWYLFIEYYIINGFLPNNVHPLARSWCYLDVLPRHNVVGWRRDGCPTQVRGGRGAWVPAATYHHDRCLRPTVPETCDGRCLSASGAPEHAEAWVPFSGSWVRRVGGEIPPTRA
jgi:hypothetical protein